MISEETASERSAADDPTTISSECDNGTAFLFLRLRLTVLFEEGCFTGGVREEGEIRGSKDGFGETKSTKPAALRFFDKTIKWLGIKFFICAERVHIDHMIMLSAVRECGTPLPLTMRVSGSESKCAL